MGLAALALGRQRHQAGLSGAIVRSRSRQPGGPTAKGRLQATSFVAATLAAATLALSGCAGGAVAVQSGFPPPPPPPVSGGLSVSGSGGLALGIVLALILADSVHWAATQLQQGAADAPAQPRRPLWQPIDRGWVDRGP